MVVPDEASGAVRIADQIICPQRRTSRWVRHPLRVDGRSEWVLPTYRLQQETYL